MIDYALHNYRLTHTTLTLDVFLFSCVKTHNRFTALLEYVWDHLVSRYQRGKTRQVETNLDLLEQVMVSGNGICWAICKSAPHPRQPRQHPTTQC